MKRELLCAKFRKQISRHGKELAHRCYSNRNINYRGTEPESELARKTRSLRTKRWTAEREDISLATNQSQKSAGQ